MKSLSILFAFILGFSLQAQQIQFESSSWTEIKNKAKAEGKLIFMDAYTTWCGPCKHMANTAFKDKAAAEYYNATFINAKIDMEKGEGPALGSQYEVNCYPTLLFIDGDGKLQHRSSGFGSIESFIEVGKTAVNPNKNFAAIKKKFEASGNNAEDAKNYLEAMNQSCMYTDMVADNYLMQLDPKEWTSKENWHILNTFVKSTKARSFVYLSKNHEEFSKIYGNEPVQTKLVSAYMDEGYRIATAPQVITADVERLNEIKSFIRSVSPESSEENILMLDASFYQSKQDWNNYFIANQTIISKYKMKDPDYLNNVSYIIYEHFDDPAKLKEAEQWAKASVDLAPDEYNLDTYACLLNKNGKKKEAIAHQKKAIAIAKKKGNDTVELEKTLKSFEEAK